MGTCLSGLAWALSVAVMRRTKAPPRGACTGAMLVSGFLAVFAAALLGSLGLDAWASIGQAVAGALVLVVAFGVLASALAPWLGRWSLLAALAGPGLAHLAAI